MSRILAAKVFVGAMIFAAACGPPPHPRVFTALKEEWSANKRLAVVAKWSDGQPLDGDQYFVLIGSHQFSAAELERGYDSDDLIFSAASPCLNIRWEDPQHLVVTCDARDISGDSIGVKRPKFQEVQINYEGIPDLTRP
jgi:hypothetical protein